MNYTYILECKDGSLYTGWTNDIEKRLDAHRNGEGAKYTRGRGPLRLIYLEVFESKEEAMQREACIKRLPRARKLALAGESDWQDRLAEWGLEGLKIEESVASADEKYMREALREAKKAYALGEVPIGCVIVYDGRIIARGYNRRNTDKNTLSHAEIAAIKKASRQLGDWRLEGCTMYVTLEPCQMCAGALVQARIDRVVIGTMNPKAGCAGSILNLLQMEQFNHQVEVTYDVCRSECTQILQRFFEELRERNKKEKEEKEKNGPKD